MNKIEWDKIEVAGTRSGEKTTTCPECSHTRKKKKDRCLSVNFDLGMAYCHHCEAVSFEDDKRQSEPVKNYLLPSQDWHNHTSLSDDMVKWCSKRMIKQQTLIHFGVTEEKQFMPQISKESNCIVFNYFEGGQVVNKKYRDGHKNFTQSKGGKPIFYNINSITGADRVYIVEGEFDVLAMYEAGIKNCISLPSGANDNDDYWHNSKPYIDNVKEFIIAVDNDEKGKVMRDKIAHRLGKWRCKFIDWRGKDANDDLIAGCIWDSVKNEQKFPVNGTFNASDYRDKILDLYENGTPSTIAPQHESWGDFKNVFSTMNGQLTTVTGIPSHGKSNFVEWYMLNLIKDYDAKVSFFSPEHHPMESHFMNFAQQALGKPTYGYGKASKMDIERFIDWSQERLYLTSGEVGDVVDWDWILERFKEQVFAFGINYFVVDAWNKVQMPKGLSGKEGIDTTLTKLTAFCQQYNVQLFLIAHPTKMAKKDNGTYTVPTLYDVSGSADFRNQSHNGFTIHRNFAQDYTEFHNMKTKMIYQGEIGKTVKLKYHIESRRYYAEGCQPWTDDLTKTEHKQKEIFENDDEFTEQTDCPF